MNLKTKFLVIGGGPAGSATALTLARAGLNVTLVEQSTYQHERVGELLSPEGQESYKKLIPETYQDYLLTNIGIVGAWDQVALTRFAEREWWTVDRLALDRHLCSEAERAGAVVKRGEKLKKVDRQGHRWKANLNGELLTADWLIDATGRASQMARSQGAQIQKFDRQVALVGFLQGPHQAPSDMLLETTELGWWYAAPIDTSRAVAVFLTDSDLDKGEARAAWCARLEESKQVKQFFGEMELAAPVKRVAAGFSLLVSAYGDRWCTVGEAYSAFDPLSNLGIGRSAEMGLNLGTALSEAVNAGIEPDLLSFYEREGSEFRAHSDLLRHEYRSVHRFPYSTFWRRRVSGSPTESPLRVRSQTNPPQKLIFCEDQNFECHQCGKCCGSGWVAQVGIERRSAIRKLYKPKESYNALRVLDDGRVATNVRSGNGECVFLSSETLKCELHHTPEKPDSCLQFPFLLRETPDGLMVGVSYLCSSAQKNTGKPLSSYTDEIKELLSRKSPNVIPRAVSVSWGRGIVWEQYRRLEDFLLRGDRPVSQQLRRLRWYLTLWLQQSRSEEILLEGPLPTQWMDEMDLQMGEYLYGQLTQEATSRVPEHGEERWFKDALERFLRSLVERKFLVLNIPLMHNLAVMAALPRTLLLFTTAEGDPEENLFKGLDTVELRLTAHGRADRTAQILARWHFELHNQLKGRPSPQGNQTATL